MGRALPILRRALVWILVIGASAPVWVVPETVVPNGYARTTVFMAMMGAALLLAAAVAWHDGRQLREGEPWGGDGVLLGAILVNLAVNVLATLTSVWPERSLWGTEAQENGLLVLVHLRLFAFFLAWHLVHERAWQRLFSFAFWPAVGVAGLLCLAVVSDTIRNWFGDVPGNIHLWFPSAVMLGGYLAVAFFIGLVLRTQVCGIYRHMLGGALCIVGVGVLCSNTGAAVTAWVVGVGVVLLVWRIASIRVGRARLHGILIGALVLLMLVVGGGRALQRSGEDTVQQRSFGPEVQAEGYQPVVWGMAWRGFLDRPVFGWGPANFRLVADRYWDATLDGLGLSEHVFQKPESLVLELLVTGGILRMLTYLAVVFFLIRNMLRRFLHGELSPIALAAMLGGIAACIIVATAYTRYFHIQILFSLLLAYGLRPQKSVMGEVRRAVQPSVWVARHHTLLLVFLCLTLIPLEAYALSRGMTASRATARAEAVIRDLLVPVEDAGRRRSELAWRVSVRDAFQVSSPHRGELLRIVTRSFMAAAAVGELRGEFVLSEAAFLISLLEREHAGFAYDYQTTYLLGHLYALQAEYLADPERSMQARSLLGMNGPLENSRAPTQVLVAELFALEGEKDVALGMLGDVEKTGNFQNLHATLMISYARAGDLAQAAKHVHDWLADGGQPESIAQAEYLVEVTTGQGRHTDSLELYLWLIENDPQPHRWLDVARSYLALGNVPLALLYTQEAVARDAQLSGEAEVLLKDHR